MSDEASIAKPITLEVERAHLWRTKLRIYATWKGLSKALRDDDAASEVVDRLIALILSYTRPTDHHFLDELEEDVAKEKKRDPTIKKNVAKLLIEKLETHYKKLATGKHRQWITELSATRLGDSEKISELFIRISDMVERLIWSGSPGYDSEDRERLIVTAAFNAVPSLEYASVVSAAEELYHTTDKWSSADAEAKLSRHQLNIDRVNDAHGNPSIGAVRWYGRGGGRGGRGGWGGRGMAGPQCYKCGGIGHRQDVCPNPDPAPADEGRAVGAHVGRDGGDRRMMQVNNDSPVGNGQGRGRGRGVRA